MLKSIRNLWDRIFNPHTLAFGIYWTYDYKKRCLRCLQPLKYSSSSDPSEMYCCDMKCNSKHILKDEEGKKITEAEAILRLKLQRKVGL